MEAGTSPAKRTCCDRRIVADGGAPAAFCQGVIGTVAGAEFSDDCRAKHLAAAGPGRCPRERVIGGCRITKDNDDQSQVFDWYYDVSEPPDGGVRDAEAFENRVDGGGAIAAVCTGTVRTAPRSRGREGARRALRLGAALGIAAGLGAPCDARGGVRLRTEGGSAPSGPCTPNVVFAEALGSVSTP